MSVTAIRAPGNGRGTDIGFERRPVPGELRRIAANVAKLPELLRRETRLFADEHPKKARPAPEGPASSCPPGICATCVAQ
jgi:hypothetical protein